ncbi:DUF397 domain-containing protein [Actinacidiphila bryophytorum]|uniref:DUF397 domain-containing protein n=1 Tax=Actinacidiphila bryophytorum TaxID=1436133 RepID=A0A9W4E0M9_9ACTN|nr:DUF397 domain-containing protein [Actinacidiphila bryophytorum]MBM9439025.1 DUF397 domain-containing protein [Actinacidiphila bryophytorum]MBN6544037.1 DUF397 domain-containing protein [Actinacidiphila bryophytorum]CAG7597552.1 conserved hypothetical protein [Actinacidiphila bryophytorum]
MTDETTRWVTSSYSQNGGQCVEVAVPTGRLDTVPVRDSKDPDGPALTFSLAAWAAFVSGVRNGDFPGV